MSARLTIVLAWALIAAVGAANAWGICVAIEHVVAWQTGTALPGEEQG